jgi:uncharacterized metal-binding protein YceD (DUF177 family)
MFTFKIFEIPEGKSSRELVLDASLLDLGEVKLIQGKIDVDFEKSAHFIRVKLQIDSEVELICDRSLDAYSYHVEKPYEILFKYDSEVEEDEHGAIRNIDSQRNQINIEQDVLDTILVHLPAKKLHPRFLDENGNAIEFETQSFGNSEVEEEAIDPRWAALKDLKK